MNQSARLNPDDRSFFSTVVQIITANPFSNERDRLESSLVPGLDHDRSNRIKKFHGLLHDRIAQLELRELRTIHQFSGSDRNLMKYAFLFHVYIPFEPKFDLVIQKQLQQPHTAVELTFAEDLISFKRRIQILYMR